MARLTSLALALLFTPMGTAWAQDDWDFEDDEDDEDEDKKPEPAKDEKAPDEKTPDGDEKTPTEGDEIDLKKELESTDSPDDDEIPMGDTPAPDYQFDEDVDPDEEPVGGGEGQDTAAIYRAKIDEMKGWAADEEAMEWETYLQQYPSSLFKNRIEARMDELGEKMFDQRISTTSGTTDAGRNELLFATPLQLENIDPRDKLRIGFEWGFPEHLAFVADYEAQLLRELSVHGGVHTRYTGTNAEVGGKYALVKSVRTQSLLTALLDLHYNFLPAYPGIRPQLGAGQRVDVAQGLDLQIQAGADLLFTPNAGLSPRLIGGINAALHANEQVTIFLESSTYMKDIGDDTLEGGGFRFNVVSFGIEFVAVKGKDDGSGRALGKVAATAPYSSNYWGYHFGAVDGDFNYYL